MMRRAPPPHFRARPMAGTSLATMARWMAAGYEVAPQGRDWLDPDDEYGRRGPILITMHPGVGAGWNGTGVSMRTGDVYDDPDDDPDDDTDDEPAPVCRPASPRVWRSGPAWDALVAADGVGHAKTARWRGDMYDWRDDEDGS